MGALRGLNKHLGCAQEYDEIGFVHTDTGLPPFVRIVCSITFALFVDRLSLCRTAAMGNVHVV